MYLHILHHYFFAIIIFLNILENFILGTLILIHLKQLLCDKVVSTVHIPLQSDKRSH